MLFRAHDWVRMGEGFSGFDTGLEYCFSSNQRSFFFVFWHPKRSRLSWIGSIPEFLNSPHLAQIGPSLGIVDRGFDFHRCPDHFRPKLFVSLLVLWLLCFTPSSKHSVVALWPTWIIEIFEIQMREYYKSIREILGYDYPVGPFQNFFPRKAT